MPCHRAPGTKGGLKYTIPEYSGLVILEQQHQPRETGCLGRVDLGAV
jgi:hypothetical protein